MVCEACGGRVFEGDVACGECGREIETPVRVQVPVPVVPPPVVQFETPPLEAEPTPIRAEQPKCAVHFDAVAVSTCTRCGRFGCATCLPEKKGLCPDCQVRVRLEENPRALKRLRTELTVSFFFAALFIAGFGLVLPLSSRRGMGPLFVWTLIGGALTAAMVVLATIFLIKRITVVAWLAVLVEIVAGCSLVIAVGPNLITVVPALFPVMTVFRIVKWRSLEAESSALAAAR